MSTSSRLTSRGKDAESAAKKEHAYLESRGTEQYAVYPYLRKSKLAGPRHPEELVRMAVYNELIEKYHYPARRLTIEHPVKIRDDEQPRFADIVVFDDDRLARPLVVVEVKKPDRKDGERQGQRYATILRAVYVLWTNGATGRSSSVLVNRYPEEAVSIDDIPTFGGKVQYAITSLRPFKDDHHMGTVVRDCHNKIRSLSSKKKPDEAFDQFLRVLFVKFLDERRAGDYEFQILMSGSPPVPEEPNKTAQRVRAMFHEAVTHDADIAAIFSEHEDIDLPNECLVQIVKLLQSFSFSATDVDQKAKAFESFLSGDMRQQFKEFMTPRRVVEAMIAMARPDPTSCILDPCCGSGAFLVSALESVRSTIQAKRLSDQQKVRQTFDFAHDRLWGADDSAQMANVGRLNMLMNEDGRAHIFKHDSLQPLSDAPLLMRGRSFDLVMTNPPFGTNMTGPKALLDSFGITKLATSSRKAHLTEILFLERNLEWLKPGGRMFIVLPDSVLGNAQLRQERAYIERMARLVAVVSLPADTFGPSGAKSKTSFVVLERSVEPEDTDADVFVADFQHIGYDFTGRITKEASQLPEIVEAFLAWENGETPRTPLVKIVPRSELGTHWLATATRQRKSTSSPSAGNETIRQRANSWRLGDICREEVNTGKTAARAAYVQSGIHMVKVGNLTGRGIQWGCVERQYVDPEWVAKYPRLMLEEGDILFTAAAHGPKWIGLKVDMFVGIPAEYGKTAVYCGELMRARVSPELEIDPYYVLLFLRSPAGYAEIQRCIRGQSGHIYRDDVMDVRIPKLGASSKEMRKAIDALKTSIEMQQQMAEQLRACEAICSRLFPGRPKPIIAS